MSSTRSKVYGNNGMNGDRRRDTRDDDADRRLDGTDPMGVETMARHSKPLDPYAFLGYREPSPDGPDLRGREGIDYVPPLFCANTRVVAPPRYMTDYTSAPVALLPESFDWANIDDVRSKRFPGCQSLPLQRYAREPPNQGACGSCWAVSSASMHTDRWRIWSQTPVPHLSATYILACASQQAGNNQCQGGMPYAAGLVCESTGIPPESCAPYTWCQPEAGGCTSAGIPTCSELQGGCVDCPPFGGGCVPTGEPVPMLYRATPRSVTSMSGRVPIRKEVFTHGPVVGCYLVFGDFLAASTADVSGGWDATNGIYMHVPNDSPYQHPGIEASGCVSCLSGRCPPSGELVHPSTCYLGGHAVVITGWGVDDDVPGFGRVEYWVVRNSWGPQWNGNGFFKVAMSGVYTYNGKRVEVNTAIGLDEPVSELFGASLGGRFGGVTVWDPATFFKEPCPHVSPPIVCPPCPGPRPSIAAGGGGGGGDGGPAFVVSGSPVSAPSGSGAGPAGGGGVAPTLVVSPYPTSIASPVPPSHESEAEALARSLAVGGGPGIANASPAASAGAPHRCSECAAAAAGLGATSLPGGYGFAPQTALALPPADYGWQGMAPASAGWSLAATGAGGGYAPPAPSGPPASVYMSMGYGFRLQSGF